MKKTLTLLALVAALMPMMPLRVNGATITTISVKGVEINRNNITLCTGWYDANKDRGSYDDDNLCWAAACSNLVTWWQQQQEYEIVAPTNSQDIWDQYRATWANEGGFADLGLHWWLDGTYEADNGKPITARAGGRSPEEGGYYADSLIWDPGYKTGVREADLKVLEINDFNNIHDLSEVLVNYIKGGYGVELSCITPKINGHSLTLWAVDYDEDSRIITSLYYTDSDDYKTALTKVSVSEIFDERQESHSTLAWTKPGVDGQYTAWKFTVLNSRLSNDIHYFNILDEESHNIIMKQNVDGKGYTLKAETQEVNDIIYDGSRGQQERLLTVEADHSAKTVQVNATQGVNLLEVQKGVELTVENVAGSGMLTKTGEGTLKISQDANTTINVKAGVVEVAGDASAFTAAVMVDGGTLLSKNGAMGDITLNNGGTLHGSGKYKNVTVNGGTLSVGNSPGQQRITGTLTLSHANLEFYVAGWEEAATLNDASWDSGTYSNIDMGYGKKFSMQDSDGIDSINIFVGGDALAALSTTATFNLGLIVDFWNMDFDVSYLDSMLDKTHFFVASEEDALTNTTWQAGQELTEYIDFYYNFKDGSRMYDSSSIHLVGTFKGVAAPTPEPTTSTLSLLALASLCARRRRK